MSNIKPYQKDGKTLYHVKGYLGIDPLTGKQKNFDRRNFKTEREADLAYSRAKVAFEDGEHNQKAINYTFEEVYNQWLDTYKNTVKESSLVRAKGIFKNHILPNFGKYRIAQIKHFHLQKVLNEWYEKYKSYSIFFGHTKSVFDYAYLQEYINKNPIHKVIVPVKNLKYSDQNKKKNFYSKPELEQFLNITRKHESLKWYTVFHLLSFSGIRRGEMNALTWDDISFKDYTLDINKTLVDGNNNTLKLQPPKYDSYRKIGLDKNTIEVLKTWKYAQAEILMGLGYNAFQPKQLVVSTLKDNTHLHLSSINNALSGILKKHPTLDKITVHGFRHTHASLLFEAGVKMDEVKERLGHKDIQTTMNIYVHLTEERKDNSGEKFANFMNL